MAVPPNVFAMAIDQALDLALRDGVVDDAERDHLAHLTDLHNRAMAVCGVLTNWTGVPRSVERIQPQPEWLPDLLNATEARRKSA